MNVVRERSSWTAASEPVTSSTVPRIPSALICSLRPVPPSLPTRPLPKPMHPTRLPQDSAAARIRVDRPSPFMLSNVNWTSHNRASRFSVDPFGDGGKQHEAHPPLRRRRSGAQRHGMGGPAGSRRAACPCRRKRLLRRRAWLGVAGGLRELSAHGRQPALHRCRVACERSRLAPRPCGSRRTRRCPWKRSTTRRPRSGSTKAARACGCIAWTPTRLPDRYADRKRLSLSARKLPGGAD